jgi:curved DNA-binding protein CbpA
MENYYEILEINTNATNEEIKAAYNRLIKIHHPDRNKDHVSSKAMTRLIIEANTILMDEEKRKAYDLKHGIIEKLPETKVVYIDRLVQSINWGAVLGAIAAIVLIILFIPLLFGDRK